MRFMIFLPVAALAVSGCQTTNSNPDVVEVCDSSGCRLQNKNVETFDPSASVPDPDPEGRLPALIAQAELDPRAAYDLGIRYMRGDGIRQNSYEALKWMRDAGERGDLRAQSALGRLYLTGLEEMGADYNEAQRWLSIAASRGDSEAKKLLAEAEAGRANEQYYQDQLRYWRNTYTYPYWYSGRYYGYWGPRYRRYYYY
ncbi:sel1 repeat family protein [Rhodobacteraceae bacterium NNCM2]|nr:sel1 repeat family protein [Coraliihabitans acroporae]